MSLELSFTFDPSTYRHYINGHATVLHCHHYMSLTTQLALDYADQGGPRVLRECAEDSIRPMLADYVAKQSIIDAAARLSVGCEYYAVMGLGQMTASGEASGGEVHLSHSHVDEGWVKKFGTSQAPINHFTAGYAAAMFSVAFDKPARGYRVQETQSIAMGSPTTVFELKLV
jgi:hypothetical protein